MAHMIALVMWDFIFGHFIETYVSSERIMFFQESLCSLIHLLYTVDIDDYTEFKNMFLRPQDSYVRAKKWVRELQRQGDLVLPSMCILP